MVEVSNKLTVSKILMLFPTLIMVFNFLSLLKCRMFKSNHRSIRACVLTITQSAAIYPKI